MDSYVKKTITCMCCQKRYETKLLKGYLIDKCENIDLDTNPHNPAIYDRVLICPHCGYATSEPYSYVHDKTKKLVKEPNYQEVLNDRLYDTICKKLLLAAYLAVKNRDSREAAYDYLLAYWYMNENHICRAEKAREKAIKNFERYLGKNSDIEAAMILVDLLRQSRRFDEAGETLTSLERFIQGKSIYEKIAVCEKKLIEKNDSGIHSLAEVAL